tara:strand:- start:89 stop:586 length:498 start_codon:yes stop_codon:yes gene_type:complete
MKSADAYENEREISNALASLAIGEVPPRLAALAKAVRAGDWQGIANAASYHLTDAATNLDEHFNLVRLNWIASNPEVFGLEVVTKADVETILAEVMHQPMPPNKKAAWKRAGLDHLQQGRGRALASVEKMRRAYQAFRDEAKGSSIASRESLRLLSILDGLKTSI